MSKLSREFKVGVVVVVGLALLFVGINYLKGENLFSHQRTFYASYDRIDGLTPSNPVVINGFKIGLVKSIDFHPDGDGRLLVTFMVDNDKLNIPYDSYAKIYSSDFLGSKAIKMELGESVVMAEDGAEFKSGIEEDITTAIRKELEPLKARTEELIGSVDAVIMNLKTVFEDSATQGLPEAFESLQRTLETFEKTSKTIDLTMNESRGRLRGILDNLGAITENVKDNNEEISNTISNFSAISDSLASVNFAQTINNADKALQDISMIMEKINTGDGSLSMLLNNDSLHSNLLNATHEMELLIDDIQANPKRYLRFSVFGGKEQKKFSKKELEQLEEILKED